MAVVLGLFQDVLVRKVNEARQVVEERMVVQESKAFQGRLELRDRQAYVVIRGVQDHAAVMGNPDSQVFKFVLLSAL